LKRERLADINASRAGEKVWIRARVQTSRPTGKKPFHILTRIFILRGTNKSVASTTVLTPPLPACLGNKMCFFQLRQNSSTIQGLVVYNETTISKQMVKFAQGITSESIVLVEGTIAQPVEPVKSCTVQDAEITITQIFVTSEAQGRLPFTLEDASRPEAEFEREDTQFSKVSLHTRLENRVLDLRVSILLPDQLPADLLKRDQSSIITLEEYNLCSHSPTFSNH